MEKFDKGAPADQCRGGSAMARQGTEGLEAWN